MARKRRQESGAKISTDLHARIVLLSELLWQANRSQMARDLDTDQSAMSRILSAKQQPGAKLLERLATWPSVNVGWLFLGQGEPILPEGLRPGVGQFLPLAEELLPGQPDEHRERLTQVSYPVAAAFYSPTAYWYRLPPKSAVARECPDVLVGDHMLIETDAKWTRRWGAVIGKFCAFRLGKGRRERVLLGRVEPTGNEYFAEYETFRVEIFGEEGDAWLVVADTPAGVGAGRRAVPGEAIVLEQVVGVGVLLERPFER
jgi:transcriptional regulator with XRE-family HTH domain